MAQHEEKIQQCAIQAKADIESLLDHLPDNEQMTERQKWLRRQGDCCIDGCNGEPEEIETYEKTSEGNVNYTPLWEAEAEVI